MYNLTATAEPSPIANGYFARRIENINTTKCSVLVLRMFLHTYTNTYAHKEPVATAVPAQYYIYYIIIFYHIRLPILPSENVKQPYAILMAAY